MAQIHQMTQKEAEAVLTKARAELKFNTATSRTYISKAMNKTFIIFPVKPGIVKVQVMAGCTC